MEVSLNHEETALNSPKWTMILVSCLPLTFFTEECSFKFRADEWWGNTFLVEIGQRHEIYLDSL
jgi:hypothetical protein